MLFFVMTFVHNENVKSNIVSGRIILALKYNAVLLKIMLFYKGIVCRCSY